MGRKPTRNLNLPPRMRKRTMRSGKVYYYYDAGLKPRKELPLGADYALALKKYSELELNSRTKAVDVITFKYVADRYEHEIIPHKSLATQRDNQRELKKLLEFFNNPPVRLDDISPRNIRRYFDKRMAKIRANREIALFSHIWNMAREWGYTDKANPVSGVRKNKEQRREVYVEDADLKVFYKAADEPTKDFLDISGIIGQRVSDVLSIRETDIRDGFINIIQAKTGKKLRITITPALQEVIERIRKRKSGYKISSLYLICNEQGQPLTYSALRKRFDNIREKTGVNFQRRDLRAKALTDKADDSDGIRAAQRLGGHTSIRTTEVYIRNRKGDKVEPTK